MFSWPYRNHGEQKNLIISQVSTFAEDTKIGGIVDTEESNLSLQKYLDQLGSGQEMAGGNDISSEWQMEFNSDQGKMMQGRNCRVNGRAKCAEG